MSDLDRQKQALAKELNDLAFNELTQVTRDGRSIFLNRLLIRKQGCTIETVEKLKQVHYERLGVIFKMEETEDPVALKVLNRSITEIDFKLQELWGFPQDPNYHRWWEVPKCVCPKLDNTDSYGTNYRIIRGDCPVHSLNKSLTK